MKNLMTWAIPGTVLAAALVVGCSADLGDRENIGQVGQRAEDCPPPPEPPPPPPPPPSQAEVDARLHSCNKIPYVTLGNLLSDLGVNLNGNMVGTLPTAGKLWREGKLALGVPVFDSRLHEKQFHSTASALKLFDIFVQAAPEIIATIQTKEVCEKNGVGQTMFNAQTGECNEDAVSCLIGYPATADHLLLCNLILDQADPNNAADLTKKKHIAVATLLSAAHTCE
jgi:hypothetical protein